MNETLRKSLTDLIDETLTELEELKKSRFSAAEIKIEGPGDGIAGKPSDGDLHAKKAEDKKDDEEDKDDEAKKAEGKNEEAAKSEDDEDEEAEEEAEKAEDKKEPHKDDPKHEEKEKKLAKELLDMHKGEMKKSIEETESLLKSAIEQRVRPLEEKLSTIFDLVKQIAEQPVPAKGATARTVPLMKSNEEGSAETLSKSEVASKLFELKKSGTKVDSADIARAEMGHDLNKIVEKYKIS